MAARKVLTGHDSPPPPPRPTVEPKPIGDRSMWAWLGLAFLLVGGVDIALTWLPTHFGAREWEFGTATNVLNSFPVPLMGLGAMLWSTQERRRRWMAALGLAAALLLLLSILLGLVLWGTGIPLAIHSAPAQAAPGLKKALIKTSIQVVVYSVLLVYMIRRAWQAMRA